MKRMKRIALGLAFILLGVFILFDIRVRPIIKKSGAYQSKVAATRVINECVYTTITENGYGYDSFCEIVAGADGSAAYVKINAPAITAFKALVTDRLQIALKTIDSSVYGIYLGSISGFELLYGRGPKIPIKIFPKGSIETALISEFSGEGINQTKHTVWLEIEANFTAFIPGYSASGVLRDKFLVAETIIVGKVPDGYTYINTSSEELLDKVYDFGLN
jgi:sporulation protein YunB